MKNLSTMYTAEELVAKKDEISKIHPDWDAKRIHESAKTKLRAKFRKDSGSINAASAKKEKNMENQTAEEPIITEEKVTSEANVATKETFNSTVVESDGSVKIFSSSTV